MAQKSEQPNPEIKIEELLRLKRHEKPDDAFWGQFDRELHQRMLHTLVKKDPLYLQILRGLTGRAAQTVGLAGAAAAFAFVAVTQNGEVGSPVSAGVSVASAAAEHPVTQMTQVAAQEFDTLAEVVVGVKDYAIDAITAELAEDYYQRDFGMDRMQVASFDSDAYSVQDAASRSSGSNLTLASLAF